MIRRRRQIFPPIFRDATRPKRHNVKAILPVDLYPGVPTAAPFPLPARPASPIFARLPSSTSFLSRLGCREFCLSNPVSPP